MQAAPWKASNELIQRVNQELSFINQESTNDLKVNKALHHNSYIVSWKNEQVGNYHPGIDPINKVDELHRRCLHIEAIGLKPCFRNCSIYWNKYENLKGFTVESGFPWVVDDYFNGDRIWRQIDEQHDHWYKDYPCLASKSKAFLKSEVHSYNELNESVHLACCYQNDKYFAELMTLKEFQLMNCH